ncbi:MAG: alkyl sulfatase dimerization domain-containing protein, partial [Thermodesulfobacteriota bacterium]
TRIIAPKGFEKAALSENLMVGPVMGRRSMYMYGNLLEKNPKGQVDAGLLKTAEAGTCSLIAPTDLIDEQGKTMDLDGVELVFQNAPGEAPVNMQVYIPQKKTLYIADNCAHSLHNIYTIRGARTREATQWADAVNRALQFQDTETIIAGHNWPRFGKDHVKAYLETQRDALKYIHDQTLRLMNHGYTPGEIADKIELPPGLADKWYLRPYYGHIKHDVQGIYSLYVGWYDANPAHLDPLPPRETGTRMVEYMGGADAVIIKAQQAYDKGEYRWVAQVLDYVVWAEPENMKARKLAAAAQTQLGYQTENATWRNAYLTAAQELNQGLKRGLIAGTGSSAGRGLIADIPTEQFFDFLGVAVNGPKAFGKRIVINWEFTDTKKNYAMTLQNAVLNYRDGSDPKAEATMTLTRDAWNKIFTRTATPAQLVMEGEMSVSGDTGKLQELFGVLDRFEFSFPIATHEPISSH